MTSSPSLPTELIQAVGLHLTSNSLYASLQVSQHWRVALLPLTWIHITKEQWCNSWFLMKRWISIERPLFSKEQEELAIKTASLLRWTKRLEWNDTLDVQQPPFQGQGRVLKGRALPNRSSAQTPFPTRPCVLKYMPNLTHFTLVYAFQDPNRGRFLRTILKPAYLPNLRVLVVHFPSTWHYIDVDPLYGLFSNLEELDICGAWHCGKEKATVKICLRAVAQTKADSRAGLTAQKTQPARPSRMSPLHPGPMPLSRLALVYRAIAPFIPYCHSLHNLILAHPPKPRSERRSILPAHQLLWLSKHLTMMPELKEISLRSLSYDFHSVTKDKDNDSDADDGCWIG